ncbi:MAG TPA: pyruvate kinase [Anaerolineae bacterium]|nr:pyruvate kinase [Anaerolineae bacterium]
MFAVAPGCVTLRSTMNYDIIATLGPHSDTPAIWQGMLDAGATVFRLNTSHLSLTQLGQWLDQLTPFLSALNPIPPLALDLQGSKWRLGEFATHMLEPGQSIELVYASTSDRSNTLPVPHADFFLAAPVSSEEIVANDAKIKLLREAVKPESVRARVIVGGEISARKGITFAASDYRREELSDKDRAILDRTRHLPFVRYAISYIRDAREMQKYRTHFGNAVYLVAKLERRTAMDDVSQIAACADELWLCRGDLGAELGLRAMAEAALRFATAIGDLPIPALLAGQVLEHMTDHPMPTRSEVCYLYEALVKGYRGFVLSDEAAIGRYPIESCRTAALFRN